VDNLGLSEDYPQPIIDLLEKHKNILDNWPDDSKKCIDPCGSVISLRAVSDCIWNAIKGMKGATPGQIDRKMDEVAQCICLTSADAECWKKWKKKVKEIFE